MKTAKEKELEIALLTEKIERISGKKVKFLTEATKVEKAIEAEKKQIEEAESFLKDIKALEKKYPEGILGNDTIFDKLDEVVKTVKEVIKDAKGTVKK